jgi:hypothetical protein
MELVDARERLPPVERLELSSAEPTKKLLPLKVKVLRPLMLIVVAKLVDVEAPTPRAKLAFELLTAKVPDPLKTTGLVEKIELAPETTALPAPVTDRVVDAGM